ncbi:MAG: sugar kinase [Anaerolineae bacterium]
MYDVVTLGETMIRLTPPGALRLEQVQALELYAGGSESNTSVGLARLGLRVCWLSRLTESPLGRWLGNTIRAQGVDTSRVVWTPDDRVGLYFLEEGQSPRDSRVIYDRRDSAMSRMQPDDLPADLFQAGMARMLHISGITLAISESAYTTAQRARELAQAAGWQISFDMNYRGKLWSPEQAREGCEPFMQTADVIFLPLRDALRVHEYNGDMSASDVIADLGSRYPQATIVMTLGEAGSLVRSKEGHVHHQGAYPATAVCRLGRGDAFTAGFLYRWLTEPHDLPLALRYGAAMAALKFSMTGDMPLVEPGEVQALVERGAAAGGIAR